MSIKNKDNVIAEKKELMANICDAVKNGDDTKLMENMATFQEMVAEQVRAEYDGQVQDSDSRVLAARGVRMLTSAENKYWNAFIEAAKTGAVDAVKNIEIAFPETTIDTVLDDIKSEFPLLSKLKVMNTTLLTKALLNKQGVQKAKWGKITSAYVEELSGDIEIIDATMYKLSAFMCIPKDFLDMGPTWIDRYVRAILVEAVGYGLEDGVVNGTGVDMPIGMNRNISASAAVVAGAYPEKTKVKLTKITPKTFGEILAKMTKSERTGRTRTLNRLLFVCNPTDYYTKIMPSTTILTPNGTYTNNVLPVPMEIVVSAAVEEGTAIVVDASRYTLMLGAKKRGFIERDDSVKFMQDEATYATKMHVNGRAGDDNDSVCLDITKLEPAFWYDFLNSQAQPTE